jgi:hypothetical protein
MTGSEGNREGPKMSDTPGPFLDNEARQIVRNKLLHYMHAHGIGVPRLAKRIKASHALGLEVTDKTLQRFLAGAIRTNDFAVAICHRLAESLTAFDPIAALGERLSVFYGVTNGRDYSGTYHSDTRVLDTADLEVRGDSNIDISADAGFWRVTEKTAPGLDPVIYDGVLVCSGDAAVVVLKDRLAGLARNYMLWPENETLHGHGATMRFLPGDTTLVWGKYKISSIEPIGIRLIKAIV